MNVNLFYNLNNLINSANNTTSNYKSTNDVVNDMYNKYSKVLSDRRKTDILTLSNNAIKTYNNKISVPASTGKTELNATKDGTHSYTIHFTSESEITSAIENGTISINGKEVKLSDDMKEQLKAFGEIAKQRHDAEVQRFNMLEDLEKQKKDGNTTKGQLENMLELFKIAQKISKGIIVSPDDERKLFEEDPKAYALAKTTSFSAKEFVLDKDYFKTKKETKNTNPLYKARDLSKYEPKAYEVQLKVSTSGNPSVAGMSIQVATE